MVGWVNPTPHLEYFEIAGILWDRRVVAKSRTWYVVPSQTSLALVATLPDLKYIETVLNIEFYTDPDTYLLVSNYMDKSIHGNTIGLTIYGGVALGTTLTMEVVAIGPP
jgi:hypothetical protein